MSGERKETKTPLVRKESGIKIQLHGDCWLYTSCSLVANFLLRYDLNEIISCPNYRRLFDGYTSEYGFPHECEEEFTTENFKSFVTPENLERTITVYLENPICHAEIYYNFLFYFIYFIGMKTRPNIRSHSAYGFVIDLMNYSNGILSKQLIAFKEAYKMYLLERLREHHEVLNEIIDNIYFLIQRFYWTNRTFVSTLSILKPEDFEDETNKELLRGILSESYIGLTYDGYDREGENRRQYMFGCGYNELRKSTSKIGYIPNGPHALVFEKYINTIDNPHVDPARPKDWGIVIKESNSDCRMIFTKKMLKLFHINNMFYISRKVERQVSTKKVMLVPSNDSAYTINPELAVKNTKAVLLEKDPTFKFKRVNVEEDQDTWTEVQKVVNTQMSDLLSVYNIIWTVLPFRNEDRLTFILERIPAINMSELDVGRGKRTTKKKKRRIIYNERRKKRNTKRIQKKRIR